MSCLLLVVLVEALPVALRGVARLHRPARHAGRRHHVAVVKHAPDLRLVRLRECRVAREPPAASAVAALGPTPTNCVRSSACRARFVRPRSAAASAPSAGGRRPVPASRPSRRTTPASPRCSTSRGTVACAVRQGPPQVGLTRARERRVRGDARGGQDLGGLRADALDLGEVVATGRGAVATTAAAAGASATARVPAPQRAPPRRRGLGLHLVVGDRLLATELLDGGFHELAQRGRFLGREGAMDERRCSALIASLTAPIEARPVPRVLDEDDALALLDFLRDRLHQLVVDADVAELRVEAARVPPSAPPTTGPAGPRSMVPTTTPIVAATDRRPCVRPCPWSGGP